VSMTQPTGESNTPATTPEPQPEQVERAVMRSHVPMELVREVTTGYQGPNDDMMERVYEQKDSIQITKGQNGKIGWELKLYCGNHTDMKDCVDRAYLIAAQIDRMFNGAGA